MEQKPLDQPTMPVESNGANETLNSDFLVDAVTAPAPVTSDAPESVESQPVLPFPVVGIGASAGGVEAYIELFRHLRSDTGMAFVVVPHLSADQRSYLPEIVARHTDMPTRIIESGMRPEPGQVYFLPPNTRVCLRSGVFELQGRSNDGTHHPIDSFLRSLAVEQKSLAIGVVLSGMDADGTLGMKSIKAEGGISIVQAVSRDASQQHLWRSRRHGAAAGRNWSPPYAGSTWPANS